MSHNDIALSFDTAEYYNLQEACDYLNRKFETDNITPKKLLKRIYEFDLDAYVYGRGFYLMGSHYLDEDKLDFLDELDKDSEDYQIYTTQIDAYLFFCDVKPSLTCKELGVFIQLSHRMISNLLLLERTEISDEWVNSAFNNKETYALNLEARPDDILILHKDLELLVNLIIENKPPAEKPEILFKKKGVSPKLLKAKMIADAHAQYLWSKDHDKKIRIGEMCELVWSYLIDTGHGEMLPERTATLKSWLSSIPQYASEAGRPQS